MTARDGDPADQAAPGRKPVGRGRLIGVLADPLLHEGVGVASMSFVGRLTDAVLHEAKRAQATAVFVCPSGPKPPCDVWIVIETGSGLDIPDIAGGVPVVATGVEATMPADVRLLHDFDIVAADVLDWLVARGATRVALCAPVAKAQWVHRLTDGYRLWCRRRQEQPAVFPYFHRAHSAREAGAAAAAGQTDAVFLISTRLQAEVVTGARSVAPHIPMVLLGEGVAEAAYNPAVGVLSLAPEPCARTLVSTALAILSGTHAGTPDGLPWQVMWP